jgi:hypothetical protein
MDDQTTACKRLLAAVIATAIKDACLAPKSKIICSDTASALNFLFGHSEFFLSLLNIDAKQFQVRLLQYVQDRQHENATPFNLSNHDRRAFAFNYRRWKNMSSKEVFSVEEELA